MATKFLTADERQELIRLHKRTKDGCVRDRLKAILWLDEGWSYEKIAQALFLDDQTIRNYWGIYQESGARGLSETQLAKLRVHLDEVTHLTAESVV